MDILKRRKVGFLGELKVTVLMDFLLAEDFYYGVIVKSVIESCC